MVELENTVVAAGLAPLRDGALLAVDDEGGLGVIALWAKHKLADEAVEQVL